MNNKINKNDFKTIIIKGLLLITIIIGNMIRINPVFANNTETTTTTTTTGAGYSMYATLLHDEESTADEDDELFSLPDPSDDIAPFSGIGGSVQSNQFLITSSLPRMFSSSSSSSSTKILNENQANINKEDNMSQPSSQTTSLIEAVKKNNIAEVERHLQNKKLETKEICLALEEAAKNGYRKILELLLPKVPKGSNDAFFEWAVRGAAENRRTEIVKMLLETHPNTPIAFALEKAIENGYTKIVEILLKLKTNPVISINFVLDKAIENGQTEIVEMLLQKNPDVAAINSALEQAAENGHTKILKMLLQKNPDVNAINSALEKAAKNGHIEIVQILLSSEGLELPTLQKTFVSLLQQIPKQGILGSYVGRETDLKNLLEEPLQLTTLDADVETANFRSLAKAIKKLIEMLEKKEQGDFISGELSQLDFDPSISEDLHKKIIEMLRPGQQLPQPATKKM